MARFIPGVTVSPHATRHIDPLTDLTRLLSRLQQTILRADAEREARLRSNEFEREKAQTNINYARSLLTKLEQDALAIKINVRRQDLQTDLNRKREVLDQITERMSDIAELAAAESNKHGDTDGNDSDASDVDDILSGIIAMTPSESLDSAKSVAAENPDQDAPDTEDRIPLDMPAPIPQQQQEHHQNQPPAIPSKPTPELTPSQTLRARPGRGPNNPEKETHHTQGTSTSTSTSTSHHNPPSPKQHPRSTATEEAILDHQRAEQDHLSESMLKLATDLKLSSQALSSSLDEDKELVSRAGDGMSQTGEGMDVVTRRMGTLQRMTEGEGYWGRLRLYAMVYGMMVVMVLVVFVLPKLRF